jgi:hydroxyacylglutathione hydrolase
MKCWTTKNGVVVTKVLSGRSNVFLISAKDKKILVDAGPGRVWKTLNHRLTKLKVNTLDYLVLTHAHFDHAGNADRIQRVFGAKVIINKYEAPFLKKGANSPTGGTNPFTGFMIKALMPAFSSFVFYHALEPNIITGTSSDFDTLNDTVSVIHTPGHTTGSQSVIVDNEIAIVGDAMFGVFPRSVLPPFGLDSEEIVKSWGILLSTKCKLYLPSHGSENTIQLVANDYKRRAVKNNTLK